MLLLKVTAECFKNETNGGEVHFHSTSFISAGINRKIDRGLKRDRPCMIGPSVGLVPLVARWTTVLFRSFAAFFSWSFSVFGARLRPSATRGSRYHLSKE